MPKSSMGVVELADALHSSAIHLLRQLRTEDRESGIGPAQLSALSVLVFGGSMSLKQLASIEQVKPPTMVRIVQGLVQQKLATTRSDDADARRVVLSATESGKRLMHRARRRRVNALARMLKQKSPSERRALGEAVAILKGLAISRSAE